MRALSLAALAIAASGCGSKLQSFLYSPWPEQSYSVPAALQPYATPQTVIASDGTPVAAYFVAAATPADRGVLYFHGNEGNMDHYWDRVEILHGFGYPVFLVPGADHGTVPQLGGAEYDTLVQQTLGAPLSGP